MDDTSPPLPFPDVIPDIKVTFPRSIPEENQLALGAMLQLVTVLLSKVTRRVLTRYSK